MLNGVTQLSVTEGAKAQAVLISELAAFARAHGSGVYGNFSPEVMRDFLAFHARQGSLRFTRDGFGRVCGLGVAWRVRSEKLLEAVQWRRPVFDWAGDDPEGDVLWIGNVIASERAMLKGMLLGLFERFPDWPRLRIFTFRKAQWRLWEIKPQALCRIVFGDGWRRGARALRDGGRRPPLQAERS